MTLRGELKESEEESCKVRIAHILFPGGSIRANPETLSFCVPLERVQIQNGARVHQTGNRSEETGVSFLLESV